MAFKELSLGNLIISLKKLDSSKSVTNIFNMRKKAKNRRIQFAKMQINKI